jgi:ABC-type nickel/cobalt efflux system permease component RcnA
VVLAIGLRTCSGPVPVLITGLGNGSSLARSALAVLATSPDKAITSEMPAILATKARERAGALVAHRLPLRALAGGGVGMPGGALLLPFGLFFAEYLFCDPADAGPLTDSSR